MSIKVKCSKCRWDKEFPEGAKVENIVRECPTCGHALQVYAIADWLRGINPSAIGD